MKLKKRIRRKIKKISKGISDFFSEDEELIGPNARGYTNKINYLSLRKVIPEWQRNTDQELLKNTEKLITFVKSNNFIEHPEKLDEIKESALQIEKITKKKRKELRSIREKIYYVTDVAKTLAQKTNSYNDLIAAEKEKKNGKYLMGYLRENYMDWRALVKLDIFKRAAYYYKKENRVGITRVVKGRDITELVKTPIILKDEIRLKGYEDQPFKRMIILGEAHLEHAVHWVDGFETNVEGIDLECLHTEFTADIIGFPDHNRCVARIRDAPGTDVEFHREKASAETIESTLMDVKRKIIHLQRKRLGPLESRLHEAQLGESLNKAELDYIRKEDYYKKRKAKKRMDTFMPDHTEEKFTWDRIIMGILIVILIITTIVGFSR